MYKIKVDRTTTKEHCRELASPSRGDVVFAEDKNAMYVKGDLVATYIAMAASYIGGVEQVDCTEWPSRS